MLRECGVDAVILGHSERRNLFHETDALIARKLALAIETGLTPILCIGEDLQVRDAGHVARFLADQIKAAAVDALENAREIVIAYEPVWAIGTGRNASGDDGRGDAGRDPPGAGALLAGALATRRSSTAAASPRTTSTTSWRTGRSTGSWSAARASIRGSSWRSTRGCGRGCGRRSAAGKSAAALTPTPLDAVSGNNSHP